MEKQGGAGKAGLLIVAIALALAGTGCNDEGDRLPGPRPWQRSTPLPVGRGGHCACAVHDNIYVMGGSVVSVLTLDAVDDVFMYDPTTGDWQSKASLPRTRAYLACSVVDGLIYVTGGTNHEAILDTIVAYDPQQNSWTKTLDMPIGQGGNRSVAIDGKIYVLERPTEPGMDNFFVYDPAQSTLKPVAPIPSGLEGASMAALAGKIYAFGGSNGTKWLDSVEEYNPRTDTWKTKASANLARGSAVAVSLGERLYVIGGFGIENGAKDENGLATVETYDPALDP